MTVISNTLFFIFQQKNKVLEITAMGQKRYEMSDEQWGQIKDLFPKAKTGRPPNLKITE